MEYPIQQHAIKSRVVQCISIYLYIEGSQVIIKKKIVLLSLKIHLILAKSEDPDEMQHINVTFHQDLHCLLKYPFRGYRSAKG